MGHRVGVRAASAAACAPCTPNGRACASPPPPHTRVRSRLLITLPARAYVCAPRSFISLPQCGFTTSYADDERDADGKLLRSHDDRTPYQLARFGEGLKGINVWYGAEFTTTLVCDFDMSAGAENPAPIGKRGWCIFERRLSSVRKDGTCCLALSQMPQGGEVLYWRDVEMACAANRLPPQPPDAFEAMMREGMAREHAAAGTGIRFTNGNDARDICIPQYREPCQTRARPHSSPHLSHTPSPCCRGSGTVWPLRGS